MTTTPMSKLEFELRASFMSAAITGLSQGGLVTKPLVAAYAHDIAGEAAILLLNKAFTSGATLPEMGAKPGHFRTYTWPENETQATYDETPQ